MKGTHKSGQILILVLLVVVVALAVGLSVASRNLTNLRTSAQADQSQRAFTAAEGGVEETLTKLNSVSTVITNGGANKVNGCLRDTADTTKANCDLTSQSGVTGAVQVVAQKSFQKTVGLGDVAQVNLKNALAGTTFSVEWGKSDEVNPKPTMEFTFVCDNTAANCAVGGTGTSTTNVSNIVSGGYGQARFAYQAEAVGGQSALSSCGTSTNGYSCKVTFSLPSSGTQNVLLLRMKPFWTRSTILVTPTGAQAASFPVQTYQITSTATTDTGVSRKVQVSRDALPQLPAVFDYVLYSGGDIIK